jgi:DNA sulfur modification protein DndB
MDSAKFTFPAVKGIQANMEYYVTMVPLDCVPKLFTFSDENLPAEVRSQRTLNKARIPEMCNYILQNPNSYVFSALTASIDGDVCFEPVSTDNSAIGVLNISMSAKLLINDGQHRKAAIEAALKKNPDLKYEHISMVLYHDIGLKRSQQMFSDLNRFAIRPTQSLNILYDNRDESSLLVKEVIDAIPGFITLVDKEHTSVPNRSVALFTLSAFYRGTTALLNNLDLTPQEQRDFAIKFWSAVYSNMPEWQDVNSGEIKSSVVRKESLSPLSISIKALGEIGNMLYQKYPKAWDKKLKGLKKIDWSKKNKLWSNGIVVNGSVQLSHATQQEMIEIIEKVIME